MKTLYQCKPGAKGVIKTLKHDQIGLRLMSMGVLPGRKIEVIRSTLFGHSFMIKVNDMHLALRKEEAESIQIAAVN